MYSHFYVSNSLKKILFPSTIRVYSKGVKEQNYTKNESLVNSVTLDSLRPNSQYIVYVTAANDKGESEASETLIAWTDPAHSPFVEV